MLLYIYIDTSFDGRETWRVSLKWQKKKKIISYTRRNISAQIFFFFPPNLFHFYFIFWKETSIFFPVIQRRQFSVWSGSQPTNTRTKKIHRLLLYISSTKSEELLMDVQKPSLNFLHLFYVLYPASFFFLGLWDEGVG